MNKTYEKIKKLLSLANSSNENEAKAAAAMASKLMIKFNISKEEIELKKKYEEIVVKESSRNQSMDKYVLNIINKYFFVLVTTRRDRLNKITQTKFSGTGENIEIATYMYEFLTRAFKDSWEDYKKVNKLPASSKGSFYYGMYKGLVDKFESAKKEVEDETGLVVVKDAGIKSWIQSKGVRLGNARRSSVRLGDANAIQAGSDVGRNLHIRAGVHGERKQSTILRISK